MTEPHSTDTVRVMLVDDSAIVRGLMSRALRTQPRIDIVSTASDGEMAINVLKHHPVDVIILDIEMPVKDGLEALPILLEIAPNAHVIMASTLTQRNAAISMKALELGASDYVPKPSSRGGAEETERFYQELIHKVLVLGQDAKKRSMRGSEPVGEGMNRLASAQDATSSAAICQHYASGGVPSSFDMPATTPQAIAIAASTGGPQALIKVLKGAKLSLSKVPTYITQHMPPTFTTLLAEHLASDSGLECREAEHGEIARSGRVYIAPGDFHMVMHADQEGVRIHLSQSPPVNFCRPAADPMFDSLAEIYGRNLLGVVLTGMGSDGLSGTRSIVNRGGSVIVQDRQSSVVWGMPGAIAGEQLCRAILPLTDIPAYINKSLGVV